MKRMGLLKLFFICTVLGIAFGIACSKEFPKPETHGMNCEEVGEMNRCENDEVFCYSRSSLSTPFCFKKDGTK